MTYAELQVTSNFSFLRGGSHPEELVLQAHALGLDAIAITDRNTLAGVVRAHCAAREVGIRFVVGARLDLLPDGTPAPRRDRIVFDPFDRADEAAAPPAPAPRRARSAESTVGWPINGPSYPSSEVLTPPAPPPQGGREAPGVRYALPLDGGGRGGGEDRRLAPAYSTSGAAIAGSASLLCFPTDRAAYGRLSQLLSRGQRRVEKGLAALWLDDVLEHAEGQILIALPPPVPDASFEGFLQRLCAAAPGRTYVAAHHLYRGDDLARIERLAGLAARHRAPLVATGDVLYHVPARRPLQDVLTCIRAKCTIDEAGLRLLANAERHLKPGYEMARLFRRWPEALERTHTIVAACRFSLDELRYDYPIDEPPEGLSVQGWLEELTWAGAAERYPDGLPDKVRTLIEHEFRLIQALGYAPYFLTVHDIVRYARSRGILCQGRGSAANSAVCYCLGITAVDPGRFDLLFERFVSAERNEPPDIDVDFEHERREEVIQYIYGKYGREHAGIAATVIHYRTRSAIREVGKALGLSADVVGGLAGSIWGWSEDGVAEGDVRARGLDPAEPRVALAMQLSKELIGFPRHLSQHVGGFVLTRSRLDQVVPVLNAAMPERTFVEWDKDDLDALGILKIDVLGLGMLTCVRKAFELLERHYGRKLTLATIPPEDPAVYEMLGRADSIGVFQVESRAQMTMLPRLKPSCFYDLIIEVAIVRPGPIQGDMVHPYLRRRAGLEPVAYPSEALRAVLEKTLGVPLFQEQAMKIAIIGAGFTASESDRLRRAMATFKRVGTIDRFSRRFVDGMVQNGYPRDFAERCFKQIEGFGTYGFPESHAASFALLVYVSSWIKCHYPDVFAAALLNSQPMGFYAPAQIVRDAREHGVTVLPVDVNASDWDCTLAALAPEASASPAAPEASVAPSSRATASAVSSPGSTGLAAPEASDLAAPEASVSPANPIGSMSSPGVTHGCPVNGSSTFARHPDRGPCDPGSPSSPVSAPGADSHHSLRHTSTVADGGENPVNGIDDALQIPSDGSETGASAAGSRVGPEDDGRGASPPKDGEPERGARTHAIRLGLREVKGLREDEMRRLVAARGAGYPSLGELRRRARIGARALDLLARADAFGSMTLDRRDAIWSAIGLDRTGHELDRPPLFAWAEDQAARAEPAVDLPAMTIGQHVAEDYRTLRLTLRTHPLALLRPKLPARTIRAAELATIENGRSVEAAGLVLVRQRPGTASGVIFITLEDETGVINLVVWPKLFERFRRVVLGAQMMTVKGVVQKEGLVVHVVAAHMADRTDLLRRLGEAEIEAPVARADRVKPGGTRRGQRKAGTGNVDFKAPLAHADHAKSSGGPDPRDPLWRPRDIDHFRSHPHLVPAPLARADEVKRNTRNTRPRPDEHRHPHQAAKVKGFKSRDFH